MAYRWVISVILLFTVLTIIDIALVHARIELSDGYATLSNGVKLPWLGMGTAAMHGEETSRAAEFHIKAGVRFFDGAEATEWYDDRALGNAIRKFASHIPRHELILSSKIHPKNLGFNETLAAFEGIMRNFHQHESENGYMDVILLHFPSCHSGIQSCRNLKSDPHKTWKESWRALEKLYADKKVRAIGVSNFSTSQLRSLLAFARVKPHISQDRMDPLYMEWDHIQLCHDNDIAVTSYSSLGGQWEYNPDHRENLVSTNKVINDIAQRVGEESYVRVVLAYFILSDIIVIPRSTNPEHIRLNADLLRPNHELFEKLTDDDLERIQSVNTLQSNQKKGQAPRSRSRRGRGRSTSEL